MAGKHHGHGRGGRNGQIQEDPHAGHRYICDDPVELGLAGVILNTQDAAFVCGDSAMLPSFNHAIRSIGGIAGKLQFGANGNGFRLDHAFVTPALLPSVGRCWYSHGEREAGISDHSILMVEAE